MFRLGLLLGSVGFAALVAGCAADERGTSDGVSALGRAGTCSGAQQTAAFERMLRAPITPTSIGGIDLTGGDWAGLTLERAEQTLCQAQAVAPEDGDDPRIETVGWGLAPAYQMTVSIDKVTRKISSYSLNDGYKGKLEIRSRPTALDRQSPNPLGDHAYSLGVGSQILRDNQPWEINWPKNCTPASHPGDDCWQLQLTELFDAAMATFAPELPSTQGNCVAEQLCLGSKTSTNRGLFGVRPLGLYFVVENVRSQPSASTPAYFYGFLVKNLPYSSADLVLQLDGPGPQVSKKGLGDLGRDCTFARGTTYGTFLESCVKVQSDSLANQALVAKLLGGATRTISTAGGAPAGTWLLEANGIAPRFASVRFDERAPLLEAPLTGLTVDVRSSGKVLNDYSADGSTLTLTATGAIYRAYAELVQDWLHAHVSVERHPLGAPECSPAPGGAVAWGCTGMEQMMLPIEPSTTTDPNLQRVSVGAGAASLGVRSTLKPGTPNVAFCTDPGTFAHCWADQDPSTDGRSGDLFGTTMVQVATILGMSTTVPEEARDPKLYARLWATAVAKYLSVASQRPTDLTGFLTPDETSVKVEVVGGDRLVIRYQENLEIELLANSSNVQTITLR